MSDTMSSSSSEHWLQFVTDVSGDPPVSGPTSGGGPETGGLTATSAGSRGLTPKSCMSKAKPVRRRSRASRRTPTTLLNANTANFRALVQKFTGCPSNSISLAAQKGPVTLNFGGNNHSQYYTTQPNYYNHKSSSSSSSSSVLAPVAYNIYHQQYCHQQQQQQQQQLLHDHHDQHQELKLHEQCVYSSLNHVGGDHVYLSGDKEEDYNVVGGEDGLSMDNMSYSLHELLALGRDSNFFMNSVSTSHDQDLSLINDGYFI